METQLHNTTIIEPNELVTSLYSLNKNWISDILFMEDEIKLMREMLERFFEAQIKDIYVNRVQLVKMQLISLGFVRKNIYQNIVRHQENIEQRITNIANKSDAFLALEDSRLADEMKDLYKAFKKMKNEVFGMVGATLRLEKSPVATC
jgi:methyl-accepting chemotaxis protein